MRFQATHKLVTYLLVLAAFATLASTGSVSRTMALLFLGLVAVSWRVDAGGAKAALFDRRLTLMRVAVAAVLVQRTWVVARQLPAPDLVPVVDFVLIALAVKLCYRRNNRDDVHVFVLSFLLVLAAAALGGNFLFTFGFVAYVLAATWALILFHLRREMEENYLVKHSAQAPSQKVGVARILASRRVVGAPFFAATGAVAVAVAAGAIATFALVPRVGGGFVFGALRASATLIGFSDDVSLGHYGTLSSENAVVALRASVPRIAALPSEDDRARATSELYWRGTVYDSYEGGHWTRSRRADLRTVLGEDDRRVFVHAAAGSAPARGLHHATPPDGRDAQAAGLDRQVIDVVSLAVPVAFALDRPVAFELEAPPAGASSTLQLAPRWSGEVGLRLAPPGAPLVGDSPEVGHSELRTAPGVRYVAYSRQAALPAPGAGDTPLAAATPANDSLRAYLQLPATLPPRVSALARQLAGPGGAPVRQIDAVVSWLRATHAYTLRLPRPTPGLDPVESFLFDTPEGHCEYFATATALLLRAVGIPTRYVNGFLGGEWNEVGHYVAVRDNRAHSWVEAFVPGAGWVRVDATPALPAAERAGRLRQLLDALDFRWSRWVVGYDLARQLELGHRLASRAGVHAPRAPGRHVPGWLMVLLAVAAVAAVASRVWPTRALPRARAPAAPTSDAPVQRLYARALARLARRGLPRHGAETPREYAARVAGAGLDGDALLAELTELYTAARFGGRPVDREALRRLGRGLASLGRTAPAR
ncbi:MAG TPA: transglutaminaseTgpA domain-containing protein [Polyangia bacterium]|nr:transglutaminaseTgpA domain-containing protein [Polyangia bacterium]